jgi:hypothetical protein
MTTASASALARSINVALQPMVAATPKQTFGWRAESTAVAVADLRHVVTPETMVSQNLI